MLSVKKTRKRIFLIIIFIAIVFVVLYFYNNSKERIKLKNTEQSIMSKLDTSEWLTYENKEYGYRFKYPKDVRILSGKDFSEDHESTFIFLPEKYLEFRDIEFVDEDKIVILPSKIPEIANIEKFIDMNYKIGINFKKDTTTQRETVLINENQPQVYIISKNKVYSISLTRRNPDYIKWLSDEQRKKAKEYYLEEIYLFKKIYSTFETFEITNKL